jgi:hypothetical protein
MKNSRKRLVAINRRDYEEILYSVDVYRSRSRLALTLSSISFAISLSCLIFIFVNL